MNDNILDIIEAAWLQPFRTKCTFARAMATPIAAAAHYGYITTELPPGDLDDEDATVFGEIWHVTPEGMDCLWNARGWCREKWGSEAPYQNAVLRTNGPARNVGGTEEPEEEAENGNV